MAITRFSHDKSQVRANELLQLIKEKSGNDRRKFERLLGDAAGKLLRRAKAEEVATGIAMLHLTGFRLEVDSSGRMTAARATAKSPVPTGGGGGGGGRGGDGRGSGGDGGDHRLGRGRGDPRVKAGGWKDDWSRGEVERRAQEVVMTPQSSNVYSFTYHRPAGQKLGTLYVSFKAPILDGDKVHKRKNRVGWNELGGEKGAIKGKSNTEGPTYAYFGVPPGIFTQMKLASSKGKFVWDKLRIRGTIYGHQYRYSLVNAALIDHDGIPMWYVPRRATSDGFKTRAIASTVQREGRRGYFVSTLPEQTFSSRRSGK